MSRTLRWWVLGLGLAGLGAVLLVAFLHIPAFGSAQHPYRDAAVAASVAHGSANVISSVNFDQRGLDTLGEETIFFGSVLAVATLLRPSDEEEVRHEPGNRTPLQVTRLFGYLLLPLALVVGLDIVAHGAVTPGGGFQGGIMLATGVHLLYVAGRYRSLEKLRPSTLFHSVEAGGAAAFAAVGFASLAVSGSFLAQVLPNGEFGQLLSSGTVEILNGVVGIAVGAGGVLLLTPFFEQVFLVSRDREGSRP